MNMYRKDEYVLIKEVIIYKIWSFIDQVTSLFLYKHYLTCKFVTICTTRVI